MVLLVSNIIFFRLHSLRNADSEVCFCLIIVMFVVGQ